MSQEREEANSNGNGNNMEKEGLEESSHDKKKVAERSNVSENEETQENCHEKEAEKSSLSFSNLKLHEGRKPLKNFECSICDYKCSTKYTLTNHIATIHEGKKMFKCSICDYNCSTKQKLTVHIEKIHEGCFLKICLFT